MLILAAALAAFPAATWAEHSDNVRDYLDYLSPDELDEIQSEIESAVTESSLDIAIVITDDTGGKSSRDYADDYYDQNGFGMGENHSGILMLINMDIREVWISTCGKAIDIFTDNRIDSMLNDIAAYLADGDYFNACKEFVNQVKKYASMGVPQGQYRDPSEDAPFSPPGHQEDDFPGMPQEQYPGRNSYSYWERARQLMISPGVYFFAAIAAVIATIIASLGNKGRVTVSNRTYEQDGSFHLSDMRDDFINQTVTRVRVANTNTGHGSGRSGTHRSSVHRSSSGRSHGGGGRRF